MIEIRESEYLAEIDGVPIVVKIEEHYLFGIWRYKVRELHSYNQALIQAFRVIQEPKKQKSIGYKTSSKQSKKKKNENKSKTN